VAVRMSDTSPPAQVIQTEIHRRMTGEERLLLALEMSDFARELAAQRIRDDHPDWSPRLITRELIRISLLPAPLPARLR
jgi:Rv0078B-related antitoxin